MGKACQTRLASFALAVVVFASSACGEQAVAPAEDFETTVIGTIQPGQTKRIEETYEPGRLVRGVMYVGITQSGAGAGINPNDLASVADGGESDLILQVEDPTGTTILDLGQIPSGTDFEFATTAAGTYVFVFTNSSGDQLKAFSMGANEVSGQD